MEKFIRKSAILIVLMIMGLSALFPKASYSASSWDIKTITTGYPVFYNTIKLDSQGNIHILYLDDPPGFGYSLNYVYQSYSGNWNITKIASSAFTESSIALDSNNLPHIAYVGQSFGEIWYSYNDNSTWHSQLIQKSNYGSSKASIDMDSFDNPHIIYNAQHPTEDLSYIRYANLTESGWKIENVDSGCSFTGTDNSLKLDSEGKPHIAYNKETSSSSNLLYATKNGSLWNKRNIGPNQNPYKIDIDLDSNNMPHIAFVNSYYSDIEYAYMTESGWITETIYDGHLIRSLDLQLDDSGNPHIVFSDYLEENNSPLKYAYFENGQWNIETIVAGDVGPASLDLDKNGNPYISFSDYGDNSLKYATTVPIPNALWLLASGLVGLAGFGRKSSR